MAPQLRAGIVPAVMSRVPARYLVLVAAAAVLLLILGEQSFWSPWSTTGTVMAQGWGDMVASVSFYLWAVVPALALWRPAVAGVAGALPFVATVSDPSGTWPLTLYVSLVAAAAAATWRSPRAAVLLSCIALAPVLTLAAGATTVVVGNRSEVELGSRSMGEVVPLTLVYAAVAAGAVAVGWWMRVSYHSAELARGLSARAEDVERTSAVIGERARLARDLHDVVAHHVSLIAVRAETAPYTVPGLSAEAAALLAEIADDSRRALDELRGVLGILGRSAEGADLAPQPGADDLSALVQAARRSGDDVRWVPGDLTTVSPSAGYVAYRVVQEALTNARRHAPGAAVALETTASGTGILVRVRNDLPEGASVQEGNGLAGMRERVESLGGTLGVLVSEGRLLVEVTVPGGAR